MVSFGIFPLKGLFPNSTIFISFEEFKSDKTMSSTNYTIVAADMVWQWYYDELGTKNVRELLGRDAIRFIENSKTDGIETASSSDEIHSSKSISDVDNKEEI